MSTASDRIDLRLIPQDKMILSMAASSQGVTLASFVKNAAMNAAREVIQQENVVYFTAEEARKYIEALDRPFLPNSNLEKAIKMADQVEKTGTFE